MTRSLLAPTLHIWNRATMRMFEPALPKDRLVAFLKEDTLNA